MTRFAARRSFPALPSLPRSFFLGHHRAGFEKMKTLLSSIDLIVECRDCRIPLTCRNPAFEQGFQEKAMGVRQRIIVFTKCDLVRLPQRYKAALMRAEAPTPVLFADPGRESAQRLLQYMRGHLHALGNLTGSRTIIVGMPNVGKSSLLNTLRYIGAAKGKAAKTGSEPGVTRKIGSGVKIIEHTEEFGALYLIDTPGVFVPYVENSEAMLKLALCGSVRDSIVGSVILADYLLFRINLVDPLIYQTFSDPTNDVEALLTGVAQKTGRLQKGGALDLDGAALWWVQQWRQGKFGEFCLDEVARDHPDGATGVRTRSIE